MPLQRDYLMRLMKELSEALARAIGLSKQKEHDAALKEIERAYRVFGLPRHMLDRLDPKSAAAMLRSPEQLSGLIEMLETEAEIHAAAGNAEIARQRRARAEQFKQLK